MNYRLRNAYKITKTAREQAARICALSASSSNSMVGDIPIWQHHYLNIGEEIGASKAAIMLAADALVEVADQGGHAARDRLWPREDDALAEAALRTGLVPFGWFE